MPTQNRVRRYQSSDLGKYLPAQNLALDGQPATLIVIEKNSPFTDLFFENLVLGAEVLDDLLLLSIDPAGEDNE